MKEKLSATGLVILILTIIVLVAVMINSAVTKEYKKRFGNQWQGRITNAGLYCVNQEGDIKFI